MKDLNSMPKQTMKEQSGRQSERRNILGKKESLEPYSQILSLVWKVELMLMRELKA